MTTSGTMPEPSQPGAHAEQLSRLAREYPYTIADITGVYVACGGDIETVERIVQLSLRPVAGDLIASLLAMLRKNQ